MNEPLEQLLSEVLDLMEQGLGVDEIAGRYPEQAAELRPFLLTAFALSNLATQPEVTAEQRSKEALLAAAERGAAQGVQPAAVAGNWLRRLLAPALALLAVVFLAGAGLVGASSFAAPGDALYETKRFIEETRVNLTADPERAAALREGFRQERIREIERLLAQGVRADVSLTGVIESMTSELWTVAGVPVAVSAATEIDGAPVVGALVQVDGRSADGVVAAERVVVRAGGIPEPIDGAGEPETARPTPEPIAPAAETPVASPTSDAGALSPPLPTATASSTPVASPTSEPPTSESPPTPPPPTATPDDDDDNDNDNDNDNDDNADDNDDNANVNDSDDNANDNDDDNGNENDDAGGNDNDDNGNDNGGGDDG